MPFLARFNANRTFAPEQLNGIEFGYRRLMGQNLYVSLAGFRNHYHDLLSQEITGAPFIETDPAPAHLLLPAQFRNGLLGTTMGGEIAVEQRFGNRWGLKGSYSFLNMDIEKAPQSGDVGTAANIEHSSPRHQVTAQSAMDLPRRLELNQTIRYVSALSGAHVNAYVTADVRFASHIGKSWELSAVGQNLLQPRHSEASGDPGPLVRIKRGAYGQITWRR
jgi:iron complex outermembrane receptor protein